MKDTTIREIERLQDDLASAARIIEVLRKHQKAERTLNFAGGSAFEMMARLEKIVSERTIDLQNSRLELQKTNENLEKIVTERTQSLEDANRELTAISEIGSIVSTSLDLNLILNQALDKILAITGLKGGGFFIYNYLTGKLVSLCCKGLSSEFQEFMQYCEVGDRLSGRVFLSGNTIYVPDLQKSDYLNEEEKKLAKREAIGAQVCIPLLSKKDVIGVMNLVSYGGIPLDSSDIALLEAVGRQIGMSVENALIFEDAMQWLRELEALLKTTALISSNLDLKELLDTIVQEAAKVFKADAISIMLLNEDKKSLSIKASQGLSIDYIKKQRISLDYVMKVLPAITYEPIVISNLQQTPLGEVSLIIREGLMSLIAAIFLKDDEPIGVLNIYSKDKIRFFTKHEINLARAFADQAMIAIQNALRYEEQVRSMEEFRILYEINQSVVSSLNLDETLNLIVESIPILVASYTAAILLLDRKGEILKVRAGIGHGYEQWSNFEMGASQGVSGYVVKTGKPQIINNVKTYPRYIKYFDEVQSELCVPLKHKEKVIGVIDIESEKLNAFNERHLKLVQNLAAFASIAIENARAYEESEQWASHLQAIQRLALELNKTLDVKFLANKVVSGLRKVISADDCRFYILNEETKELIPLAQKGSSQAYKFPSLEVLRLKVGEGITGVVAKTGKPLAIPDAKIHPHSKLIPGTKDIDESMLICPLIFENKVKGVISLSKLGLNRFSEGDLRLLMIFSSHAAIALENAKLYEVRMSQLNEIHKLKDFNENIVNSLDEGIWIEDKNGVATFVNPQLARITGLNCQDLAGQHWSKIFAPRFHNIIRNETEKRFQGISSRYEAALLNKDGEEVPILISAIPLFSDEGIEGVLAAITDISELKKMEMKMVRSARLGALGEMAGGVAHDFNNILGAILGRVQLLMRKTTDPNILNGLKIIEKASIDGGETVRRVQNFTRVRTFEKFVMISINELLHDAVTMTQARWKEFAEATGIKIKIEEHYSPVPNLAGNPSELREVFTNLIINAVDALPQGGTIGIETGYFDNQISISISDDGVGIPKEIIDKIFDPFFTTKGVRGTGLGLSVSYGIISRHHGDILVKSTVGKGSVFTIMLPVVKADKEEDKSELVSFISSPKLKVVVIDDEEHLRDLLADILGVDGHSVFTAPGGKEGLELVEQHNPDIVFTDLGMPYISGWEVVKAVKERNSGTPVVMVTGWGDQLDKKKITEMKVDAVIAKPFQVNQIIETLQKVVLRK